MKARILYIKPPDPFLQDEFVYQQLGPHYLQAYTNQLGYESELLVLYVKDRRAPLRGLEDLHMLLVRGESIVHEGSFSLDVVESFDLLAFSVMSPQATYAYWLSEAVRKSYPEKKLMIGGSHARYYLDQVKTLPEEKAFDYIVPLDGWGPIEQVLSEGLKSSDNPVLAHRQDLKKILVPPTRPLELMERYHYEVAGLKTYHTVTALGCPFTCYFCEAGTENIHFFPKKMLDADLHSIARVHKELGRTRYALMFFDDTGLLSPRQVEGLSILVKKHGFSAWRSFSHAYLICKHGEKMLNPFLESGGRRVGIGLETGSQKSLDLINKRNGRKQLVEEHYEAVRIANSLGIAVDGFTMIYPWETEADLKATTDLVEFIVGNPIEGEDELGRPLRNHVDSTIMLPFQGTRFNELFRSRAIRGVRIKDEIDNSLLYHKGIDASSGWVYEETVLPRERYLLEQEYRNSLRPGYR
ncbi:radical SAM protein [bacterium]|nr:radical SAM protein [bacterium]